MKSVSQLLREARLSEEITQQDLAARSGQCVRVVAKAEAGERVKLSTLRRIFECFPKLTDQDWREWVAANLYHAAGPYSGCVKISASSRTDDQADKVARWLRALPKEKCEVMIEAMKNPKMVQIIQMLFKSEAEAKEKAIAEIVRRGRG